MDTHTYKQAGRRSILAVVAAILLVLLCSQPEMGAALVVDPRSAGSEKAK